jgi:hypothetical protein
MFYLQHGHGKSTKIEECAADGNVAGIILSPGHEDVAALADTVNRSRSQGLTVLIDPQSYVYSTDPQGQMRYHGAHGLSFTQMHWALSATELTALIQAVGDSNRNAGTEKPWICPAPFHRSLTDYWMPSAIQFARTATEQWNGGVIATIAIDEAVLSDWDRVADWLDVLTTLDVVGFYLLVSRKPALYPSANWEGTNLSNLLRLIHVLSVVNEYEVIWGYADVDGLLGTAAGVTAVASGWSYGLRQFSVDRYNEKRAGGAPAVPRVYVPSLLSDIRSNEAEDIYRGVENGESIFPEPLRTEFASRSFDSLSNPAAQCQHLRTLAADVSSLANEPDLSSRLNVLTKRIKSAKQNFKWLQSSGLELDPRYVNRLNIYEDSLTIFRKSVAL